MLTFIIVCLCIAAILLGAVAGKPVGWIALGFATLAMLAQLSTFIR